VAELSRLDIPIEPENPEAVEEREQIFAALIGGNNPGLQATDPVAAQTIRIRAFFDSESRTYLHRDELIMTVIAEQDCYFKIIHIDAGNRIKMIYPNSNDTNNYLRANTARTIFEIAKYYFYGPYGAEEILVVASSEQFANIEQDYITPWTLATAEAIRGAIGRSRGGDAEGGNSGPIRFDGDGVARYPISVITPHEEYEANRPDDMRMTIEAMRRDVESRGGVFYGSEQSGYYILNNVRGSYRVPRDAPDTMQFAVYYLITD
jgi:hypothetical protein